MKKVYRLFFVIVISLVLPNIVFAEEVRTIIPDYSWYESDDKEKYLISSEEQLIGFANIVNGKADGIEKDTFKDKIVYLQKNLNLTGIVWTPIGSSMYDHMSDSPDTKMFEGTFDGSYHTITGLSSDNYIALEEDISSGEHSYGLFGYGYGASVKNLNLANVNIHCSGAAGADGAGVAALIGYYVPKDDYASTIDNVHVLSGTVQATNNMGGIIGYMNIQGSKIDIDVTIKNTTNAAKVITDAREAGGIVGLFQNGWSHRGSLKFINCVNYGDVIANPGASNTIASGILGREQSYGDYKYDFKVYFENCINEGNIVANGKSGSGTEAHAAGISTVYYVRGAPMIVNNCLNKGNITINGSSVDNFIDGIIAHPSGSSNDDVTILLQNASYNLGTITAPKSKTTFVRYDVNGSIGNIVPLRIAAGTNITISDGSSLVREGYVFNGWNTKIDGTGDAYAGGEQLKIESSLTLYAQWRREKSTWSVLAPPPAFYTGSPIKPKVVVYDENDSLIDIDKYVVTYQDDFDCIDVGRKTIKVTYNNEEIEVEYDIIKSRMDISITTSSKEIEGNQNLKLYVSGVEGNNVQLICDDPDVVINYSGNNIYSVVIPNKDREYLFTAITMDNGNNFGISSSVLVTGIKSNESTVTNPNTKDYKYIILIVPIIIVLIGIINNYKYIRKDQYERG